MSRKIRGNDVDFSNMEIYGKSTKKGRGNWSKFGLQRMDVILTLNRCGFDVVCPSAKTFSRHLAKISSRRFQNVSSSKTVLVITPSRSIQPVSETYIKDGYL